MITASLAIMSRKPSKANFSAGVAFVSPYKLIKVKKERSRGAAAIYMNPPTNAFSGLYNALGRNRRDLYLGAVSGTAILSEFLPALLNNVPYRVIQTYLAHVVCTWIAVGVLSIMVLVVLASFFVDWPDLPIDPSTILGATFYAYSLQPLPGGRGSAETVLSGVDGGIDLCN